MSKIQVSIKDNVITITMPHAQILSYEIDHDSVEVLDERNNVFNPISIVDKVDFDKETALEMKGRAVRSGLLEKAEHNAKVVLSSLLTTSIKNIDDYTIEFAFVSD